MGNTLSPCCYPSSKSSVKLILWEGTTRVITGKCLAGEIMFQFPDRIVCHAESFYIGQQVPELRLDDELVRGQTYFILPVDLFAGQVLSAKSLASLASAPNCRPVNFTHFPFQYLKGPNGRMLIKVPPEFIMRIISEAGAEKARAETRTSPLCSTPELQKHYAMLVGSKEQVWSPRLETIAEKKASLSPYRLLGLDWRSEKMEV
ncbi:uncharacterized protein [Aristolochia californica]|uniref:uncharacterized protein n=1 Tax=Aristolochia californica TaxID=171875 RepID=UPI0035D58243